MIPKRIPDVPPGDVIDTLSLQMPFAPPSTHSYMLTSSVCSSLQTGCLDVKFNGVRPGGTRRHGW